MLLNTQLLDVREQTQVKKCIKSFMKELNFKILFLLTPMGNSAIAQQQN